MAGTVYLNDEEVKKVEGAIQWQTFTGWITAEERRYLLEMLAKFVAIEGPMEE